MVTNLRGRWSTASGNGDLDVEEFPGLVSGALRCFKMLFDALSLFLLEDFTPWTSM